MAMSVTSPSGREGSPSSLAASVSGGMKDLGPLVGAIDQGTGSTRFLVFAANTAELVTYHQIEVESINPKQGWVEQDPLQLLRTVEQCISATVMNLSRLDVDLADCVAVGIANQRETTIVWDKLTGEPLYNAILWLDTRTQGTVEAILARLPRDANSANYLQHLCGLPISTYFSALKIRWLLDNVKEVALALKEDRLLFGTVDTWLLWKLTGGEVHATDVTNASRTMLMNIETLKWDPYLLKFFGIPESILPEIRSSSEIYGKLASTELKGTPISGVLGDQQAALVGQGCFRPGQAKNTYGTGCFLLYNVGPRVVFSERGLLSTVAYKLGPNRPAAYALEGSVAVAGAASLWLKDRLGCIDKVADVEALASSVPDSADCYFVPAFSGLYAPYWRPDARGILCGMTQFTSREHVCRAALESIAFQTREILEAMECDSSLGLSSSSLLVDGGMSQNGLLMQIQSDLIGVPVLRPAMAETTALGAAIAAGCADGIDAWDLRSVAGEVTTDKFLPRLTEEERDVRLDRWKLAVSKSFGWATAASPSGGGSEEGGGGRPRTAVAVVSDSTRRLFASVPPAMFMFSSLMLWKLADAVAEGTSNS